MTSSKPAGRQRDWTGAWAALWLVAATLLFFHPVVTGRGHFWDDFLNDVAPTLDYLVSRLARGELPLWVPEQHCGYPLALGGIHWSYPFFLLLIPFVRDGHLPGFVMEMFFLAHLVLLGWFSWRYLRDQGVGFWAALNGALGVSLCAPMVVMLYYPTVICSAVWVPPACLLIERFLRGGGWPLIPAAGVCAGLIFLAGHSQWSFYLLAFVGVYALFSLVSHGWRRRSVAGVGRGVGGIAAVFLLAGLVAMVRLLPELEYTRQSTRMAEASEKLLTAPEFSRPFYVLANAVFPHAWGKIEGSGRTFLYWGRKGYEHVTGFWYYWEDGSYVGLLPLLGVPVGLWFGRRDRRFLLMAALAATAILYGCGVRNPLRIAAGRLFPLLQSMRYHARLTSLWLGFALPWAYAFLLDRWFRAGPDARRKWLATPGHRWAAGAFLFVSLAAGLALWAGLTARFADPIPRRVLMLNLAVFVAVLLGGGVFFVWPRPLGRHPAVLGGILAGLLWLDLYHATGGLHTYPRSFVETMRPNPAEKALMDIREQSPEPWRSAWRGHQANRRVMYLGLESWNGYVPNPHARWNELQTVAEKAGRMDKAYDLMNVRFDLNETMRTGRLRDRMATMAPRVYTVHATVTVAPENVLECVVADEFDCRLACVTEEPAAYAVEPLPAGARDRVSIESYRAQRRIVRADMAAAGVLVFSEHNYPGWRARVNGRPARLLTVNGVNCAVPLPAGTHRVELRFEPAVVRWGLAVSAAAMIGALAVVVWGALRGRWRGSAPLSASVG